MNKQHKLNLGLFVIRLFSQYVIENGPETKLNSYFHNNFETQQTQENTNTNNNEQTAIIPLTPTLKQQQQNQAYLNDPSDPLALLLKSMIDYLIDTDKKYVK